MLAIFTPTYICMEDNNEAYGHQNNKLLISILSSNKISFWFDFVTGITKLYQVDELYIRSSPPNLPK
jgi:hypothetical protein